MDSSHTDYWGNRYANAYEVLIALCRNFGVIPRYYFSASNRHTIQLIGRGRSFSTALTFPSPISSDYAPFTDVLIGGTSIQKYDGYATSFAGAATLGSIDFPLPPSFNPDIEFELELGLDGDYGGANVWNFLKSYDTTDIWNVTYCEWYNYFSGAWVDTETKLSAALAQMLYWRFQGAGYKPSFERRYPGLKANLSGTDSTVNLHIGQLTSLTAYSGASSLGYYATEVRKNVMRHESSVKWLRV